MREGPGYAVDVALDGADAVQLAEANLYDLVIVDLMMPELSGDEVVRKLRRAWLSMPPLILTARVDIEDTIALLNRGTDDYTTKPFDLGELIARAGALIRRSNGTSGPIRHFGSVSLHTGEQSVHVRDLSIELSPTEYRILEHLMFRPTIIVSNRELLEHLYEVTWEHRPNVIEVHVSNLRKKLRAAAETVILQKYHSREYRLADAP